MVTGYVAPELRDLTLEVFDNGVAVMTIARPERMNSMTVNMFSEFGIVAQALRDTDVRALVITGAGDRAFCAGFDLDEIDVIGTYGNRGFLKFQEVASFGLAALHHLPFPVIAAVHGAAAGGGLILSLIADVRLAAPDVKFNAAFIRVGLSTGELGLSWLLPRVIGLGRAAEWAFTGRNVGAEEAERVGLVNRVVEKDRLLDEALAMAAEIASYERGGVRFSKRALTRNQEVMSYGVAVELENRGQAALIRSPGSAARLRALAAPQTRPIPACGPLRA
jgi:enoyl-CoA hydratase/carnithine racemase